MFWINLCILVWIGMSDVMMHRVPNIALLTLLLLNVTQLQGLQFRYLIFLSILLIFANIVFRVGMGDVKLVFILALMIGSNYFTLYLPRMLVATTIWLCLYLVYLWHIEGVSFQRLMTIEIPLAPPIIIAVMRLLER